MNFSIFNLDFNYLLTNGLQFSFGLLKKNVEKVVSQNALKVVKNAVFGKNSKQNIKNNNIRLKTGDSVTFVVTKNGLEKLINTEEESLLEGHNSVLTCAHKEHTPDCADHQILCEKCLKNQLKSKL